MKLVPSLLSLSALAAVPIVYPFTMTCPSPYLSNSNPVNSCKGPPNPTHTGNPSRISPESTPFPKLASISGSTYETSFPQYFKHYEEGTWQSLNADLKEVRNELDIFENEAKAFLSQPNAHLQTSGIVAFIKQAQRLDRKALGVAAKLGCPNQALHRLCETLIAISVRLDPLMEVVKIMTFDPNSHGGQGILRQEQLTPSQGIRFSKLVAESEHIQEDLNACANDLSTHQQSANRKSLLLQRVANFVDVASAFEDELGCEGNAFSTVCTWLRQVQELCAQIVEWRKKDRYEGLEQYNFSCC